MAAKKWKLEKLFKEKELTVNHLHLKATSRTVLSCNVEAILIYFMKLGSSSYLAMIEEGKKKENTSYAIQTIKKERPYEHKHVNILCHNSTNILI